MTDPHFYREYECNISAPYLRGRKGIKTPRLEATTIVATHYEGLDKDFDRTVYTGIERDTSYFVIGPDKCSDLSNTVVCGHIEIVSISDTTVGWYRGFIRGTATQLSVGNLENVPINQNAVVWSLGTDTLTVNLASQIPYVQWKVTIYNRS